MVRRRSDTDAMYVISVAAELAGVHPQTLRVYERKGLLTPQRTSGNTRRYSPQDIERLRRIQDLTQEGINLAGVTRILQLERKLRDLEERYERALHEVDALEARMNELLAGTADFPLVPFRDVRRVRRAMKADQVDMAGRRRVFTVGPIDEEHDDQR